MQIKLSVSSKSLKPFEIDLPRLTILTGKNGSGKTHLLKAIKGRTAKAILNDEEIHSIALFDQSEFSGNLSTRETQKIYQTLRTLEQAIIKIKEYVELIRSSTKNYHSYMNEPLTIQNKLDFDYDSVAHVFFKAAKELSSNENFYDNGVSTFDVILYLSKPTISVDNEALVLKTEIGLIYRAYDICREFVRSTERWAFAVKQGDLNEEYIDKDMESISLERFEESYGPPPWERIQQSLSEVGLELSSSHKEVVAGGAFKFKGVGQSSVDIENLSSGERTLLALAIFLFQKTYNVSFPSLILLDEADAFLHPTYSRKMIDIMEQLIKDNNNIHIVLATHSIATVSFALPENLFLMDYDKRVPVASDRHTALSRLTDGVPYFKVFTDDDISVVCESFKDKEFYELLYASHFWSEGYAGLPKLNYIALSSKSSREGVIDVVRLIRGNGIDSIVGIIDYDNNEFHEKSIYISGAGERYTLENFLLDPLILASLARSEGYGAAGLDVGEIDNYMLTADYISNNAQFIVDSICKRIADEFEIVSEGAQNIETLNGLKYSLPKWFVEMPGHILEQRLVIIFKCLKGVKASSNSVDIDKLGRKVIHQHRGLLSKKLIDSALLRA
ncbi:MAG: ATP-binding protein [Euryhalocaulis sp.]|uniref:ATP-binding protein n=1 Tax=Euryhalocaulis sp. TaxID=2744307 RepID=UPI0017FE2866|nr:ATP-binding protein [Euryhalocaulis sp.]MBA4800569.1 ATP-binding protein [Euryhalocaulis sp.]